LPIEVEIAVGNRSTVVQAEASLPIRKIVSIHISIVVCIGVEFQI
jgi:hypothetical protein